jgi:hypothetical protein
MLCMHTVIRESMHTAGHIADVARTDGSSRKTHDHTQLSQICISHIHTHGQRQQTQAKAEIGPQGPYNKQDDVHKTPFLLAPQMGGSNPMFTITLTQVVMTHRGTESSDESCHRLLRPRRSTGTKGITYRGACLPKTPAANTHEPTYPITQTSKISDCTPGTCSGITQPFTLCCAAPATTCMHCHCHTPAQASTCLAASLGLCTSTP